MKELRRGEYIFMYISRRRFEICKFAYGNFVFGSLAFYCKSIYILGINFVSSFFAGPIVKQYVH